MKRIAIAVREVLALVDAAAHQGTHEAALVACGGIEVGNLAEIRAISLPQAARAISSTGCTTAATAWIIATGASDWKMFRPMSTPAAPSDTARR